MLTRKGVAAILSLAVLCAIVGCKKKEVAQRPQSDAPAPITTPAPEPPDFSGERPPARNTGAPPTVQTARLVVDEEVRKHWSAVELTVREKKPGGGAQTLRVPLGGEATVPGTGIVIKALSFVPDFAMSANSITTKSMRDVNPAVKIQVIEGGKELFKGWSFRNAPEMHSFTDPRYTIRLTRAIAAGKQ